MKALHFASAALLPAIARRADQLCSLCLGYGLGGTFDETEDARVGVRVTFDDVTPNVLRLLCITDVLYELIDHLSVALDENYIDEEIYRNTKLEMQEIVKLLNGYIKYLKEKKGMEK